MNFSQFLSEFKKFASPVQTQLNDRDGNYPPVCLFRSEPLLRITATVNILNRV